MWGERPLSATMEGDSGALPGFQAAYFPIALVDAAGLAAHPVFGTARPHIAGKEILAGETVHIIGRSDGRDGAAGASLRVFPRLACAIVAAAEHFRRGRPGKGKITVTRLRLGGYAGQLVLNRAGGVGNRLFLAFFEQRIELIREAAAARGQRRRPGGVLKADTAEHSA